MQSYNELQNGLSEIDRMLLQHKLQQIEKVLLIVFSNNTNLNFILNNQYSWNLCHLEASTSDLMEEMSHIWGGGGGGINE